MASIAHTLEVSYKLRMPRRRRRAGIRPEERELLQNLVAIAQRTGSGRTMLPSGVPADFFEYAPLRKRRIVGWRYRTSRQARAAETQMRKLRRGNRRMGIRTKVRVVREREESLEETKKYSITAGQYRSLIKGGKARECLECHQCLPRYKGRYPKSCPGCGGDVAMPIEDAVEDIQDGANVNDVIADLIEKDDYSKKRKKKIWKATRIGGVTGALGTPISLAVMQGRKVTPGHLARAALAGATAGTVTGHVGARLNIPKRKPKR